jgi:hypothetical protein
VTSGPLGLHQLRAASLVLRVLDGRAHSIEVVRNAYRTISTAGEHSSIELVAGEDLLVDLGLVTRTSKMLRPAVRPELALHTLEDIEIMQALGGLAALGPQVWRSQANLAEFLARIGAAGEEAVATACRRELEARGAPELARAVERVSIVSDRFGFDVRAPRIGGASRLLEVKTQVGHSSCTCHFHLTRNEYEVGRDEIDWSLVVCTCTARNAEVTAVNICGWCTAETLRPYLPLDANGRWSEAVVVLPRSALRAGLPSGVIE